MSIPIRSVSPLASAQGSEGAAGRNVWMDHLRIGLTVLVVLHHVAIVYGGSGGWYWKEAREASSLPLVVFNAVNQSFFMGFFFLLAGYFTPSPYERKGAGRFLRERLARLGIPLLVYFFVLSPLTSALAAWGNGHSFRGSLGEIVRRGRFEPGPLWFAEALLLMALGYVLWRSLKRAQARPVSPAVPRWSYILAACVLIGAANVLVRLWIPVGQSHWGLQLGYFPAYIVLFAVGCAAAEGRGLERVSAGQALPWIIVSFLLLLVLPFVVNSAPDLGAFLGGLNAHAVFYAFWDPFIAAGIILGMLYLAREYLGRSSVLADWLARRAFGIFIVHPLAVVGVTLLLRSWSAPALLKFMVAGVLSVAASAALAEILFRLPGGRRVL